VVVAFLSFRFIPQQFFPFADRDLVIVEMQLPEGTHYKKTEEQALLIEKAIRGKPEVLSVSTFIGRGVPAFYYNLPRIPNAPHVAQFIVRTSDAAAAKKFKFDHEHELAQLSPFANVLVKEIAQGPPVKAPIEVRILSHDPAQLQAATHKVLAAVRSAEGTANPRSTIGVGAMNVRFDVNDAAASTYGVTRAEVSSAALANTRGLPITVYRGGRDPFSITLSSRNGEKSTLKDLQSAYLGNTRTDTLTIGLLTSQSVTFSPTLIEHYDRVPYVSVLAELSQGAAEGATNSNVKEALEKMGSIEGVEIQMAGAEAESAAASQAIFGALPAGLFLLLISLMFEFNSFRRVGIILLTVPLCAVGAVPGLLLSGSTFGFMTLLGFFTLAGTVIHNGIFLLDYIDHRIHDGIDIETAITEGIQRRMRPILLTAIATIVELLPMTLSSSTLWPPFAWAIISGLTVSTLMTLLVIPAVYKMAFQKEINLKNFLPSQRTAGTIATLIIGFIIFTSSPLTSHAGPAESKSTITLNELITKAAHGLEGPAIQLEVESSRLEAEGAWREAYAPKILAIGQASQNDRSLGVVTPFGVFSGPNKTSAYGAISVEQPLFNLAQSRSAEAADLKSEAIKLKGEHDIKENQSKAIGYFLQAVDLREKRKALQKYIENLQIRQKEIQRLYQIGGLSEADLLKVKIGIDDAKQAVREALQKEEFLASLIAQTIGEKGKIYPAELVDVLPQVEIQLPENLLEKRADLKGLEKQIESIEMSARAADAATLPNLSASATYFNADQEILNHKDWISFGVQITWPIFDGGVQSKQSSAAKAQKKSLEYKKQSAELAIHALIKDSVENLKLKRLEVEEKESAAKSAEKVSTLEFKRLSSGKVSVNDVLDAEDLLKDRREKASSSKVEWYAEWFRFQSALGLDFKTP